MSAEQDENVLDETLIEQLRVACARPRITGAKEIVTPVELAVVDRAEATLEFSIDARLRQVYVSVAGAGFGPGYGALPLLGDESVVSTYAAFRAGGEWPARLLPIWDWGGAAWSCVDVLGRVVTHDDVAGATLTNHSVRSWLEAWANGVDLWNEIYEDRTDSIVNPLTGRPIATKVRARAKGSAWILPSS